jgi:hypothetical protein
MATPVVPSQFAVGKNRIIHKPTTATFSFETGHTTFRSINWGRAYGQPNLDLANDGGASAASMPAPRPPFEDHLSTF